MSFSVAIVGLPNVGKSTLFKALTRKEVGIAPRPFTTIHPNLGIVSVPDERLEKIAEIIKPQEITPTVIEFVDIAGLVKDAYKGEGLGNQFLAQIRNCDAIVEVVRVFLDDKVEHVSGEINPRQDIEIIKTELLMKDLETLETVLSKVDQKKEKKKFDTCQNIKEGLQRGRAISETEVSEEEKEFLKELQLLTNKPVIFVFNEGGRNIETIDSGLPPFLRLNLKLEEEISQLSNDEAKELDMESELDSLIVSCYKALNLITFYTVAGDKETRAWTLPKGSMTPEAAGKVHSDFQKRFIKAEVINWKDLIGAGSWTKARSSGLLKIEGKEYIVEDGDVIEFKI